MTAGHPAFEPHPALAVLDGPDLLHIGFDDLLKYHGLGSIGGVAIAFRAMHAAFARLAPAGAPIRRRSVSVLSAFAGPGATDAFEMVLRVRTDGRLHVDTDIDAPGAAAAPRGRFFFQFETPQCVRALGLRDGVVAPGFNALAREAAQGPLAAADAQRLREMKFELARRALALGEADLLVELPPVVGPARAEAAQRAARTCGKARRVKT